MAGKLEAFAGRLLAGRRVVPALKAAKKNFISEKEFMRFAKFSKEPSAPASPFFDWLRQERERREWDDREVA